MHTEKTSFNGLFIITPTVYSDPRGYFMESYHREKWFAGTQIHFLQDNESLSVKNVLRGLHFQKPPFAQAKLIRVVQGSVLDVVVDLRKNEPTFGKFFKIILSGENKKQLYIPEGFAHGFLTLEDHTVFNYKCSEYYHVPSEECIIWNDPSLQIDWNIDNPILSEKDKKGMDFKTFKENINCF